MSTGSPDAAVERSEGTQHAQIQASDVPADALVSIMDVVGMEYIVREWPMMQDPVPTQDLFEDSSSEAELNGNPFASDAEDSNSSADYETSIEWQSSDETECQEWT